MIKDYICEHGVKHGEPSEPIVWNGPVGTCECCGRVFFYIDSINMSKQGTSGRTWTPKNRCSKCGGEYKDF